MTGEANDIGGMWRGLFLREEGFVGGGESVFVYALPTQGPRLWQWRETGIGTM